MVVIEVVTIAHVAFAAAWFGHMLLIPRDVRVSVRDPANGVLLVDRVRRARVLGIVSGLVTLGSGVWLVLLTTGFGDAPLQTHVAMGTVVLMLIIALFVARPAWSRIAVAIREGDTPGAVGGVAAFNKALTLESLLWIVALAMMII